MRIISAASGASAWSGYEYYKRKNIVSFQKMNDDEYIGEGAGTAEAPYQVKINLAHVRQSQCDCPHAKGTRIICKHMVALYFTAFPHEAERYMAEVVEYERDEEARVKTHYKMFPKNDNMGENNILQNQFTAYLVTAVHRRRTRYLQAKAKQERYETPLEERESRREAPCERVMINHLHLHCALEKLKKRELRILTMKVLEGYTLQEIADEMNSKCAAIRSAYYRTLKKLRGELEGK